MDQPQWQPVGTYKPRPLKSGSKSTQKIRMLVADFDSIDVENYDYTLKQN